MSDQESEEFEEKRRNLTKQQRTYGIFGVPEHVKSLPINSKPNRKSKKHHGPGLGNFRKGEIINPNAQQIQINVPTKKKKTVSFAKEDEVWVIPKEGDSRKNGQIQQQSVSEEVQIEEEEKPQIGQFSLASFLGQLGAADDSSGSKEEVKEEGEEQQQLPRTLPDKVREKLKLYKYSEYGDKDNIQYDIPTTFGDKSTHQGTGAPKKRKTKQQIQLEEEYRRNYGQGFKMMSKVGFVAGQGLGKDGKGITAPVEAVKKSQLLVEDDESVLRPRKINDDQESKDQQEEAKGPTELFEYFSLDDEIDKFIRSLQNQYQLYESMISKHEAEVEKMQNHIEIIHSNLLVREEEAKQLTTQIQELEDLKKDLLRSDQKYPHLALKFNLDLLVVKNAIEEVCVTSVRELVSRRQDIVMCVDSTCYRLEQLYLQKERELIKNFTGQHDLKNLLYEKVIDLEGLESKARLSDQEAQKINKFICLILQDSILPTFENGLKAWNVDFHELTEHLISIFELIQRYHPQKSKSLLEQYVYPELNRYLSAFSAPPSLNKKGSSLLPHLMVFPWFGVIEVGKLDFAGFVDRIHTLNWNIEDSAAGEVLIELLKPWKQYIPLHLYSDIVFFTVSPRLLYMMKEFRVSASANDSQNITKLKAMMKFASFVPQTVTEAIVQDTLLPELESTTKQLVEKKSGREVGGWLDNWRRTVVRLCHTDTIVNRLDYISTLVN